MTDRMKLEIGRRVVISDAWTRLIGRTGEIHKGTVIQADKMYPNGLQFVIVKFDSNETITAGNVFNTSHLMVISD